MARGLEICVAVLLFFAGLFTLLYPSLNGARLENASLEAAESFIDAFIVPVETGSPVALPGGNAETLWEAVRGHGGVQREDICGGAERPI